MAKEPKKYCKHILESINDIEIYVDGLSKKDFLNNKLVKDAVIRKLEIIGEAVTNLPHEFKEKHHHIPWRKISSTRNQLIHGYFNVDHDLVWQIIESNLPSLKKKIKNILNK